MAAARARRTPGNLYAGEIPMIRRFLLAAMCLASASAATPHLTTIQDVLYKADGTPFNGVLTISWNSFQSTDSADIVTQSITVKVVSGNLHVQLVPSPTTPPSYYTVVYNSDGKVQFQETWSVPSSGQPVRVSAVRVTTAGAGAITSGGQITTGPITESQVTGLVADLAARPLEGAAFTPSRAAIINALGSIDGATGNASDCLHVDGSSGACGSGGGTSASFEDGDSPAGIVDGSNTTFTLSATPSPAGSLALYRNGIMQKATQDFTISGNTLTFVTADAPQPGDTLLASYRVAGTGGTGQSNPSPQVLCSGTGASTTAATMSSIGACAIPAGLLLAGDRVEIHFDLAHTGTVSGFTFEVQWGATALVNRTGATSDALVSGRAEAAVLASGSQLSAQSWGSVLPFSATVAPSTDAYASGITINFLGTLASAGDTLTLANYSVIRVP
jgi:hypothetical protein